jgi:hypothetical protein
MPKTNSQKNARREASAVAGMLRKLSAHYRKTSMSHPDDKASITYGGLATHLFYAAESIETELDLTGYLYSPAYRPER